MEAEFWHERWRNEEIGFHQAEHSAWLVEHWPSLGLAPGDRVLVPLCGKSLDMRWLDEQGFEVRGVELSPVAVRAYFEEARTSPEVAQRGPLSFYRAGRTGIFCGDFFDLRAADLGTVRGVFDRGALVALPPEMRPQYVEHMLGLLADSAAILLITQEYDQERVSGPPFAVHPEDVSRLFGEGERCRIELLATVETDGVPPPFSAAGVTRMRESVYRISKLS